MGSSSGVQEGLGPSTPATLNSVIARTVSVLRVAISMRTISVTGPKAMPYTYRLSFDHRKCAMIFSASWLHCRVAKLYTTGFSAGPFCAIPTSHLPSGDQTVDQILSEP